MCGTTASVMPMCLTARSVSSSAISQYFIPGVEQLVEPELERRDQLRVDAGLLEPRPLEVGDR